MFDTFAIHKNIIYVHSSIKDLIVKFNIDDSSLIMIDSPFKPICSMTMVDDKTYCLNSNGSRISSINWKHETVSHFDCSKNKIRCLSCANLIEHRERDNFIAKLYHKVIDANQQAFNNGQKDKIEIRNTFSDIQIQTKS